MRRRLYTGLVASGLLGAGAATLWMQPAGVMDPLVAWAAVVANQWHPPSFDCDPEGCRTYVIGLLRDYAAIQCACTE